MPHIVKADHDAVQNFAHLAVSGGVHPLYRVLSVVDRVHRLYRLSAGTLCSAVLPIRLRHLDMGGVHEHYLAEVDRFLSRVYLAPEAVLA
jgi:hypothetical protein